VNVVAMAWTALICAIMMMPPNQLAGETMAGLTLGLALWYAVSERHRFRAASALKAGAAEVLDSEA